MGGRKRGKEGERNRDKEIKLYSRRISGNMIPSNCLVLRISTGLIEGPMVWEWVCVLSPSISNRYSVSPLNFVQVIT